MTAPIRPMHHTAALRGRLLLWCAAILLFLQLLAATGHAHGTDAEPQECVACSVHAQAQAAPLTWSGGAQPAPAAWRLAGIVTPAGASRRSAGCPRALLPPPHAPPAPFPSA